MRKLPLLLALALCHLAVPIEGVARAQSPPQAAATSPAQRLREQGSAAANAGQLPEALAAWRAAWALRPDDRNLACDIGRGELLSGHNIEAARWMSRCVRLTRDSGTPEGVERRRSEVLDLAVARSYVAEISLEVEDGAALLLDGQSLGASPLREPLFVEPGQHRLEALKGIKGASAAIAIEAAAGQDLRVSLALKLEPPPFLAPEPQEPKEGRRSPLPSAALAARAQGAFVWWPAVTGAAVTVATFGVGVGFSFSSSMAEYESESTRARIEDATLGRGCRELTDHPECGDYVEADRRKVAFSKAASGLFVAGGVVAAATLLYVAHERGRVSASVTTSGAAVRYLW